MVAAGFRYVERSGGKLTTDPVLLHTNLQDERHPLRQRNCNLLLNVLDAGPTSPREDLLSDAERDTPEPTRTDAFVSEKAVSNIAAR